MKILIPFILLSTSMTAIASDVLNVYGPGGPAPAMLEVANKFTDETGIKINMNFGPQSKWENNAKKNADLIFSGSEIMLHNQKKIFNLSKSKALYLRPSVILVRKENAKKITGLKSLLNKNIKIMVVNGAGQAGLWEDIVSKTGSIDDVNNFISSIVYYADNSAKALEQWNNNSNIDAWIIWNHWYDKVKSNSDMVEIESEYRILRPVSIAYTNKGIRNENSNKFVDFLEGKQAQEIFTKHGWKKEW